MIESGNILPSKLLTKPIPRVEKKTNSGIILPNQVVKDVNISSTVVKIGSGVPADILIKEGDTVLYNPHAVQRLVLEDKEYGIVDYKDLLFIYTPSEPVA
jgi:co-chaperonin GroES (HSP10)